MKSDAPLANQRHYGSQDFREYSGLRRQAERQNFELVDLVIVRKPEIRTVIWTYVHMKVCVLEV